MNKDEVITQQNLPYERHDPGRVVELAHRLDAGNFKFRQAEGGILTNSG
jgi:hypothetical protein